MYKLSTVLIGVFIAVMVSMNSLLAVKTNNIFSALIIHLVGISTAGIIVLVKKEKPVDSGKMPVYIFCAGIIGVSLVYLNNACIAALGVSLTLALCLIGQSALSCVIDHFGLFGVKINRFDRKKLIGFALSFLGVMIMVFS